MEHLWCFITLESFSFSFMQSDSYQATGCYNLLCAGFIQTNSKIAIGAAISPVSSYAGNQYDISILIWKVYISSTCKNPFHIKKNIFSCLCCCEFELGSKGRKLVDEFRRQHIGRILASRAIHTSRRSRHHGGMGRRGGELALQRPTHLHPNGLRPFRRRRIRKSELLSQSRDCGHW